MSSTAVQLVFAGEILAGFSEAQVREKLGQRLRLDEQRLNKLFSGQRVVIKRDLSPAEAADWVQRFRAIGAVLHAIPAKPPATHAPTLGAPKAPPTPSPAPSAKTPAPPPPARRSSAPPPDTSLMLSLVPDSELPPPPPPPRALAPSRASAPVAAAAATGPEEITCPNCGERQSKRVICRSCVCDMPRTLAARQAEAEARRQARLDELRARNEQRLAQEQQPDEPLDAAEIPPLLSFSFEGRMGRLRFIATTALALVLTLGLLVASFALTLALQSKAVGVVSLLLALGLAVWGTRLQVLRLHDFNRSGWLALLLLVPGLNALLALALWVWPGDHDENDYGPAVNDGSWLWALLGLVVLGAFAILTTPMLLAGVARATA